MSSSSSNKKKPTSHKTTSGKKSTPTKTSQRKTPSKKSKKQGSNSVKYILTGMMLMVFILIGTIIILDQRAMKRGQVGIVESITGIHPARTARDIETRTAEVLEEFGIDSSAIRRIGYTSRNAGSNKKLRHLVYNVPGSDVFQKLVSEFEDRIQKKGVRVHNRHVIKQPHEWILSVYLGTYSGRTHKLDLHCFLKGTPTPAPIPEKYTRKKTPEPTQKQTTSQGPRICLIFDDFGQNMDIARRFLDELDIPVTLAVIPYQTNSEKIIAMIREAGQTVLLHMPMEPLDPSAMGTDADIYLTTSMDDTMLRNKTRKMLDACKGVQGVNNHTGSKMTADRHCMEIILSEIKKNNLFFVDSRTIGNTVAEDVARELGIPTASRKIFIDQGYNGGDVGANMARLVEEARKTGFAIGIGHAIDSTLDQVITALPDIQDQGIEIVPIKSLVY
ncbi:divergent polysaccharide deacetylase family protein [bacterium]|nr:divergent polysaccharide deacetylase family protein [bacterium]